MRALKVATLLITLGSVMFAMTSCGAVGAPTETLGASQREQFASLEALSAIDLDPGVRPSVVATTSVVADVTQHVGGEWIELTALIPPGSDPHTHELSPGDLRAVAQADVVLLNGLGLEAALMTSIGQAAEGVPLISLSEGIEGLRFDSLEAEAHTDHPEEGQVDPHVWLDPLLVKVWVERVKDVLSALDPAHADVYGRNAAAYLQTLDELDQWIRAEVGRIPASRRILVTDHHALGYFAARYGFEIVGAVIPAYSTAASASAQGLAELVEVLEARQIPAIFVSTTINPRVAARLADDTGALTVPLYIGALSDPEGPAGTYLDMMRADVQAMVAALGDS
jgi:ABC-type Zn uptake system ZnuABC Zn-binding protein ZnuA